MKLLYYLMFRIYRFYLDRGIERDIPFFYMSVAVTVLIGVNTFTIFFLLNYFHLVRDITEILSNKYYVLIPISILWSIVYFGISKPKRFLNYDFGKTRKGGFAVVGYIVLTAITFILVANLNRARLAEDRLANPFKTEEVKEKKPSLEGKIRKWFKE